MEWIDVKDRLPEWHGSYLVYGTNFGIKVCHYSDYDTTYGRRMKYTWFKNSGSSHYSKKSITHWMPLPKPPTNV